MAPPKTDAEVWAERRARALLDAEIDDRARAAIGSHPETFMVGRKVRQVRADVEVNSDVKRATAAVIGGLFGLVAIGLVYIAPWLVLVIVGTIVVLFCAMLAAAWADGR